MKLVLAAAVALWGVANSGRADWLTFGGDPQRTGWAKQETAITKENVGRLRVLWKAKLDSAPKEMTSLTAPLVAGGIITPRGFMELVFVAGASDSVHAIDVDTGKVFWQRKLAAEGTPKSPPHWLCPNALNATPVISKERRTIYVLVSDGKLHSLSIVNGEDLAPPIAFVPPFSKNWSLNLVDGVLYTAISQGCNGAKSAVYAMDLNKPERPVTSFLANHHRRGGDMGPGRGGDQRRRLRVRGDGRRTLRCGGR